MSRRLQVDVFFDFICPWCLIGKRQLEHAQVQLRSRHPDVQISTVWHGVQLLPQLPVEGEPFADFYRKLWDSGSAGAEIPMRVVRDGRETWLRVKSADRNSFLRKPPLQ